MRFCRPTGGRAGAEGRHCSLLEAAYEQGMAPAPKSPLDPAHIYLPMVRLRSSPKIRTSQAAAMRQREQRAFGAWRRAVSRSRTRPGLVRSQ